MHQKMCWNWQFNITVLCLIIWIDLISCQEWSFLSSLPCPSSVGDSARNCSCFDSEESLDIQCPFGPDGETFNVNYSHGLKSNRTLTLDCPFDSTVLDESSTCSTSVYNFLNNVPINNVSVIELKFCPLPSSSLSSLIHQWTNISSIHKLTFRSSCKPIETLSSSTFEQLNQLIHLNLQFNHLQELPSNLFASTTNLQELLLDENEIHHIQNGLFSNLNLLFKLQLGSNKIKKIEERGFTDLHDLYQLNLQGNLLDDLPSNVFKNLKALTILDLSKNQITNLSDTLFSSNTQLKELNLRYNLISALPSGLFKNNNKMLKLSLNGNKNLDTIGWKAFEGLDLLQELDLSNCNLNLLSLNSEDFNGLSQLKRLDLHGNRLGGLSSGWFSALTNLETLDLSENQLTSIEPDTFSVLSRLNSLSLQRNKLVQLENNLFGGLGALKQLILSHNHLSEIGSKTFEPLSELQEIDLSHNNLTLHSELPKDEFYGEQSPLRSNLNLQVINLSYNRIDEIFYDWHNMNNLAQLNLRYNRINSLHFNDLSFSLLKSLEIDLRDNLIDTVSFSAASVLDVGSDSSTKSLTRSILMDDNPLNCDCRVFHLVQYMNRSLPGLMYSWTIDAPTLTCREPRHLLDQRPTSVDPSQLVCPCEMENSPCRCRQRPHDKTILVDCQETNLTTMPDLLPHLNGYQIQLNLSGNHIDLALNDNQTGYRDLTAIDLSQNNLTSEIFDGDWWKSTHLVFPKLARLHLNHNRLESVPSRVIQVWNDTRGLTLSLSANPWRCDCSNRPLLDFLFSSWNRVGDYNQIFCHNGQRFSSLTMETMCPSITTALKITAVTLPLLALLILVVFLVAYRNRKTIRAWLYSHQICLGCVANNFEDDDVDRPYDAFISYSHKDEDFVTQELVPHLEQPADGQPPFRLCLHYRDWLAGEWIPEQISRSVASSKRTIVVLSEHFLDSLWGKLEFRTAYQQALKDKCMRLIIIVKGDVPDKEKLDEELKSYLSLNTYLKWGDPWFWHRLNYALPHRKGVTESGYKLADNIKEFSDPIGMEQERGAKLNQLPPLPLLTSRDANPINVVLPPDIEMSFTPTSSSVSAGSNNSSAPLFPSSAS